MGGSSLLFFFCALLVLGSNANVESEDYVPSIPVRLTHNGDYDKLYRTIPRVSIDHPVGQNEVDVYVLKEDVPLLAKNNYSYTVLEDTAREEFLRFRERQQERRRQAEPGPPEDTQDWTDYHNHFELEACLRNYTETYPEVTELFTIGKSVQGRELWGIKITKNIHEEDHSKPELHYVGNMHGDEVVGKELLLRFIGYYLDTYAANAGSSEARAECLTPLVKLMESTVIYIIPTMNPDGFALGRRENANRYDLNRNFPDQYRGSSSNIQPETRAIMNWVDEHNFVISINYHGGSVVVSYPYDGTPNGLNVYSRSPEDTVIRMMALEYASFNQEMLDNDEFRDGVTNGAAWYPLYGGMADWKYVEQADIELTVELSYTKWPRPNTLEHYWNSNRHSMVNFFANIFKGVWGRITVTENGVTRGCSEGKVLADSVTRPLITNSEGYFFRVLNPGTHNLVFSCGVGRNTDRMEVIVEADSCDPVKLDYDFE